MPAVKPLLTASQRVQGMPDFASRHLPIWVMALSFSSLVCAQSDDERAFTGPDQARKGGRVSIGLSSRADFSDSSRASVSVMPAVEYQWANGWFAGTNRGVGYNFSKDPALQYGLGLGLDFGRKESTTGPLSGMGSIGSQVEYGAFLNYAPDRNWRLNSVLRYGAGSTGQGVMANLGASYTMHIAPQWRLEWGVATTWANAQYMQSYYGVSAAQSLSSGHAVYSPGAGISDVSTSLNLSYQATPRVSVTGGLKATSLVGSARTSPTVSSPRSVSGSVSVGYAF